MTNFKDSFGTMSPAIGRLASLYRAAQGAMRAHGDHSVERAANPWGEVSASIPVVLPRIAPTIGPVGLERLIAVRNVRDEPVVVRGGATGREYRFAAHEAQQVPLVDARILVAEGEFGFSGG